MAALPMSKAARLLSQRGASKGGRARAAKLTAAERSAIARQAAQARWQMDAEERSARKNVMPSEEIGDLFLIPDGLRLLFVIAEQQDQTHLTDAGVQALQQYLRRWRRWHTKQQG